MKFVKRYDFEFVYTSYYNDIYQYIYSINYNKEGVEDIVQNTFLKAMIGLKSFRGESQLQTWLMTIARNESIRYAQKEKTSCSLNDTGELACTINIADTCCNKEMSTYVMEYISSCEEPKRSLLILHLLWELPFVEIGKILGKSDNWCRVTFFRAKNDIIEKLEV